MQQSRQKSQYFEVSPHHANLEMLPTCPLQNSKNICTEYLSGFSTNLKVLREIGLPRIKI